MIPAPRVSVELSLHVLTDEAVPFERLLEVIGAAVANGASVIQLRAKRASAREQIRQATRIGSIIDGRAAFVIDDRLDVALAARDAGAQIDGVHLGQDDVPPQVARRLLGGDALIGWTANTAAHLAEAAAMPTGTVDYLGVGVIRPTSTKPDHPAPLGVDGFASLAATTPFPCVAIGGIRVADAPALRAAGAAGIAVVSAVCCAADPAAATRALRAGFEAVPA